MADNKKKKKHDGVFIDLQDRSELRYRARAWKYPIVAIQVAAFVTKSNTAKKVLTWLQKNWKQITTSRR